MKKLLIICFAFLSFDGFCQTFYTDLYGFKLGQFRDAAKNELGNPIQYGKFEDGFVFEAFLLKPDTSLYIIFEYAARDTNIIWSIQVSGSNTTTDIGFKNAKLGIDKTQTEKIFGKPTSKEDIEEFGNRWVYDKTNFSIELNTKNKLSSIKILDNSDELFPHGPDFNKIPNFEDIKKILSSNNKEEILKLLSGDVEIYKKDRTYYFKKSFLTELKSDYSKMFSNLQEISKDLSTVKSDEYEENMRLIYGHDTQHVIKIKGDHIVKEIVLKIFGRQYLIYEINANDN